MSLAMNPVRFLAHFSPFSGVSTAGRLVAAPGSLVSDGNPFVGNGGALAQDCDTDRLEWASYVTECKRARVRKAYEARSGGQSPEAILTHA
jgi:hypothetical protein